ncbi:MAG: serine hydrolase [Desulfobacteraceae bacterium]
MNKKDEDRITGLLNEGAETNVYPGAVLLIARGGKVLYLKATGILSTVSPRIETKTNSIYDLASLTKPLATTVAIMGLVDRGIIHLDNRLDEILPDPVSDDKKDISIRLLLCHSSGLPDWRPYYSELMKYDHDDRKKKLRQWILKEPLVYHPGTDSKYSDLGFMLLEWIIEESSKMKMDELLSEYYFKPLKLDRFFMINKMALFSPGEIAATEECQWRKKVIHGQVHDENAFALGGYSGHAGLFGCAEDIFILINMLREHYNSERFDFFRPETVQKFLSRQVVYANSTWALGWDTPSLEGSSSGRYFSAKSIGHLGFTGTSVWMDLEKDIMVIFLSNRVHRTRENTKIRLFRPELHNLIMESIVDKKAKIESV